MLNKSGESGCPCLVSDIREIALNSSLLSIMLAVNLSYMVFIMLKYVPSIPNLLRVSFFNHKTVLYFVKFLFCIYWDNYMIFIFHSIDVVYHWLICVSRASFYRDVEFTLLIFSWEFLHLKLLGIVVCSFLFW